MTSPTWRTHGSRLLVGTLLGYASLVGCATGEEDPLLGPAEALTPAPSTSDSGNLPGDRPAFDAGFDESDSSVNPPPPPPPDGGGPCADNVDPGSSETTAKALPDTSDAQNNPVLVKGVLNGPIDVDFYRLNVKDQFGSVLQADIRSNASGAEMCVFVKCSMGDAVVTCSGASKKSDLGLDGCCTTASGDATPSWSCPDAFGGLDASATLYMRVKATAPTPNQCLSYSFSYAF